MVFDFQTLTYLRSKRSISLSRAKILSCGKFNESTNALVKKVLASDRFLQQKRGSRKDAKTPSKKEIAVVVFLLGVFASLRANFSGKSLGNPSLFPLPKAFDNPLIPFLSPYLPPLFQELVAASPH